MNHSPHLKSYVKMHPDNKMAWYLLGKEYESSGQEGKANYCFNRAGKCSRPSSINRFRQTYGWSIRINWFRCLRRRRGERPERVIC